MLSGRKIVDISLALDAKNFGMRTPAGFTKDLQFAIEVLKEHDAPGGAGQIVRGVRNMRFNQSILSALGNVEFSSEPARSGAYSYSNVVPAAKIEGFRFTSSTDF